ncbi:MAG TPA: transposase [Chloroflexota bacterium]|jgi:IS605 OrfB family transposase
MSVTRTARQPLVGVAVWQDTAFQRTNAVSKRVEEHYLTLLHAHVGDGWLATASAALQARLEEATIRTQGHPDVLDEWDLDRVAPRFPSYLRRAVMRHAIGQARSWWTRYQRWLSKRDRHNRHQAERLARGKPASAFEEHPPTFPEASGKNYTMYFTQTCQVLGHNEAGFDLTAGYVRTVALKVLDEHGQWVWTTVHLRVPTRLYRPVDGWVIDPPKLINKGGLWRLHIPYHRKVEVYRFAEWHALHAPVLGVDLNERRHARAVLVEVKQNRTTGRSRFVREAELGTPRLHDLLQHIRAAYKSQGQWDLPRHFCLAQWRHIRRVADEQAHKLACEIVATARRWGLMVIVLENLASLAPARWRRGTRNQRLTYWLHRRTARYVKNNARAAGILVGVINPAGTSSTCPHRTIVPGVHWIVRGDYGRHVRCSCGWFHDADRAGAWNVGIAWWDRQDSRAISTPPIRQAA